MDTIVKVYISGPALSLLLYENLRCLNNQEGFLLGKKYARKLSKITDHDETVETIEWEIHINSVIPSPKLGSFYKGSGSIMPNLLLSLLNDLHDDVVGWYTFKRDPELRLCVREKIIHKNLSAIFSTDAMDHFVWCLNIVNNNQEKHTSKQSFIRYVDAPRQKINGFQEIPLHIINLSDSRNEYKSAGIPFDCLNRLITELKNNSPTADRNSLISKLEDTLQDEITRTVKAVSASEQELFQLEQDIYQLTQRSETPKVDCKYDSNDDYLTDGNNSNEDVGIVAESPISKMVTRHRKACEVAAVREQSSPLNGVALDRDRGDSSTPPTSAVPTPRSYSQAAKVKP